MPYKLRGKGDEAVTLHLPDEPAIFEKACEQLRALRTHPGLYGCGNHTFWRVADENRHRTSQFSSSNPLLIKGLSR